MDIIFICITILLVTAMVCISFGPNLYNHVAKPAIIPEAVKEEIKQIEQEDQEAVNALVTALGEVNNIFGGVEDED